MKQKRLVTVLQCASALGAMSYGVMFTVLDDFRNEYGITESKLGLIVAAGFVAGFLSNVFVAPIADKGFARRLVAIGLVTQIVGCFVMAFGSSFIVLLLGRFLTGIGGGAADPALRRIIILANPDEMGSNLGRIVAAGVAGFALGPVVSAVTVGPLGLASPFLIVAGAMAIVLLFLLQVHVNEAARDEAPSQRFAFDLLLVRPIAGVVVIGLSLYIMIGTFDSIWSVMMDDIKAPDWVASVGITVFALPMIFLAPLGGRLTQKYGPFRASITGLTLAAICMTLYGTLSSPYLMLGVGVLHGIIDGLTITGGSAALAMVAPSNRLASAQGVYNGTLTLSGGLAAGLAGATYDRIGQSTYIVCAGVMIVLIYSGALLARQYLGIRAEATQPVVAD
jgi:MFS family permease